MGLTARRPRVRHRAWAGGFSVWSLHVLHVSAWVLSGFSGFLPQSKDTLIGVRLIGDSKLPVGVNVLVDGCLSLCCLSICALRLTGDQPRVYSASRPMAAGIGSSPP